MGLDFSVVPQFWDVLLLGMFWTIALTVLAGLLSFVAGIALALIALYAPAVIRWPVRGFEWLFLGTRCCCNYS